MGVLVLSVVLAALMVLDHGALPLAVVVLLVNASVLLRLRGRAWQHRRQDQLLAVEAARGVRELERWLATGRRA